MKLNHIKDEVCPVCQARTMKEEQPWQHTNGDWQESRTFRCGMVIEYSPNYREIRVNKQCPYDPEAIKKKQEMDYELEKLKKYINRLKLPDMTKTYLIEKIKYCL